MMALNEAAGEQAAPAASGARIAAMLGVLIGAFALSHVYRTLPAVLEAGLVRDFTLDARALGLFAGAFHIAFALLQLPLGVALDRFGPRRTVASLFALACVGAALSAVAPSFPLLVAAQLLIGAGCSGALMGALVFAARWYPPARFASISGLIIALGSVGMLVSATPMAWVAQSFGWRGAFAVLAVLSVAATAACALLVRDAPPAGSSRSEGSVSAAFRGLVDVLRQPRTAGILLFALTAYPVALTFRGVWLGPYLTERWAMDTVAMGNVALGLSAGMILGPVLFGRLDPGDRGRRFLISAGALLTAALLGGLAIWGGQSFVADCAAMLVWSLSSAYFVLQFAEARRAYPDHLTGRALATLNMATFLGVALLQWLAGVAADDASGRGVDRIAVVLMLLGGALLAGLLAFLLLPAARPAPTR